ncbi:hypothetical protein BB558_001193 [Smittium angustum]|uniref:AB hydrolase-1 domain-containing protein n=1 Tax=Smittium angustum TaxID=133377 RepID=A0A2U1JC23_SMIAN|nr:hypothetical protein BB558_001193 [Smittium angustum]
MNFPTNFKTFIFQTESVVDKVPIEIFVAIKTKHQTPKNIDPDGKPGYKNDVAAIYVHPYPPLGGNFCNNVVTRLSNELAKNSTDIGIHLLVNTRGAGNSGGKTSWTGENEVHDISGILGGLDKGMIPIYGNQTGSNIKAAGLDIIENENQNYLDLKELGINRVLLIGYSFGAMVISGIDTFGFGFDVSMVLISYPYSVMWALSLFNSKKYLKNIEQTLSRIQKAYENKEFRRVLMVSGSKDNFTSIETYKEWWNEMQSTIVDNEHKDILTTRIIPDVDHFYFGKEILVFECVYSWLNGL